MKLFVGAKAFVVHEGKVLILREQRYDGGTNEGKWDVPGGRIDPEESFFDGLTREIKEESDLAIEAKNTLHAGENFPIIKGETCHIIRIYVACLVVGSPEVKLSQDHDQFDWIDPKKHTNYKLIDTPTDNVHDVFERYIELQKLDT